MEGTFLRGRAEALERRFGAALACQVLVGTLMVAFTIDHEPFWRDEAASVSVASRGVAGILEVLRETDGNMGFYYLLLHLWMLAGTSEAWVRALSAVFALATIPVVALLGRRLFGAGAGVLAGFLAASNMFLIVYAQEARGYALGLFLGTLATWLLVEAVERPCVSLLVGYAAAASLAVYASFFSGLTLVAHVVALAFLPQARRLVRPLAAAYAGIGIATVPLVLFLLATGTEQVSWIPRPGVGTLGRLGLELTGSAPLLLVDGALVAVALASAPGAWADRRVRWRYVLVAGWLALPPLVLLAAALVKPLFVMRYLLGCAPALAILAALGIVTLAGRSTRLAVGVAVVLACLSLVARVRFGGGRNEDLRAAAAMVGRESEPGDALVFAPAFARVGFSWYFRRLAGGPHARPRDVALAGGGEPEAVGSLYAREVPGPVLAARLQEHRRVWVVGYPDSDWHPTPEPMAEGGFAALGREYRLVRSRDLDGLQVDLYERAAVQ